MKTVGFDLEFALFNEVYYGIYRSLKRWSIRYNKFHINTSKIASRSYYYEIK